MSSSPVYRQASLALSRGEPLAALNLVAGDTGPHARAIRGIALAQLQDLDHADAELRAAADAFREVPLFRARALAALAEVGVARRHLGSALDDLRDAAHQLDALGDSRNAAWARLVRVRALLLLGDTQAAEADLAHASATPPQDAQVKGALALARAATSARLLTADDALAPLREVLAELTEDAHPAMVAELRTHLQALQLPLARIRLRDREADVSLSDLARLFRGRGSLPFPDAAGQAATRWFIVDAIARRVFFGAGPVVALATRDVLFDLVAAIAREWPEPVTTDALILGVFHGTAGDESYQHRCRVDLGRLRRLLPDDAAIEALGHAWRLVLPDGAVALSVELIREQSALAVLLADGHAWAARDLGTAIGMSQRTIQRTLSALAGGGDVRQVGRARSQRWISTDPDGSPLRIATQMYLASLLAPRDA